MISVSDIYFVYNFSDAIFHIAFSLLRMLAFAFAVPNIAKTFY